MTVHGEKARGDWEPESGERIPEIGNPISESEKEEARRVSAGFARSGDSKEETRGWARPSGAGRLVRLN